MTEQPLTEIIPAELPPLPATLVELETDPPPACTCTPVLPAELLLEMLPAPDPLEDPAALMLPSALRWTVTLQG